MNSINTVLKKKNKSFPVYIRYITGDPPTLVVAFLELCDNHRDSSYSYTLFRTQLFSYNARMKLSIFFSHPRKTNFRLYQFNFILSKLLFFQIHQWYMKYALINKRLACIPSRNISAVFLGFNSFDI